MRVINFKSKSVCILFFKFILDNEFTETNAVEINEYTPYSQDVHIKTENDNTSEKNTLRKSYSYFSSFNVITISYILLYF